MKKIAVFTGTRAEYGLLYWIIKGLDESPNVELQLLVGGMHLSHEFGFTVEKIVDDGFLITERLDFLLSSDSSVGISKSLGLAIITAAESFSRLEPDLVVILGDRFESLAIAQAAMISTIPIAHIHGGELTQALIDDGIRHSITKMAHFHFTSTENYRRRVIQMGEHPDSVFNVGAPGIDSIKKLSLITREELSSYFNFSFNKKYFLITYHPVTLIKGGGIEALENLIKALDYFESYNVVITFPNADTNGRNLITVLSLYAEKNPNRVLLLESMGQLRYLSAMKHAVAVIGNSSSGIIEAPSLKVATVNIGDRQKGRDASESIEHCADNVEDIYKSITRVINQEYQDRVKNVVNTYGTGGASKKIVKFLESQEIPKNVQKVFYDIDYEK
ncbi:MAG: UDP-hydrolyzing UDP-N-acetyl-D-glucosamine 2-epimerase [Colwellia sp.]|jgi:UDP-hydrolysing UDP-N-acetyl-D-glucosamine 2-epimerase